MDTILIPIYIVIFIFGIVLGSFLNVCIYRIPKKEDIVKARSHCMQCGHLLGWYELIPLFSYKGGSVESARVKSPFSIR